MLRFSANTVDALEFSVIGLSADKVIEIASANKLIVNGAIPYSARVSELEDGKSHGIRVTTTMLVGRVQILFSTIAQSMDYEEADRLVKAGAMEMSEGDKGKLDDILIKKALVQ